jgi:ABC-type branched-subunit amino acid transport system substrate-binding protein
VQFPGQLGPLSDGQGHSHRHRAHRRDRTGAVGLRPTDGGGSTPAESLGPSRSARPLPQTGNLAFLGPPEEAGVAYAVSQINEATADTGLTLDVVYGDSGDTDNKAYETEIPASWAEDVSAIIGAASSGTSLQFIDQVVGAGVIQFSPGQHLGRLHHVRRQRTVLPYRPVGRPAGRGARQPDR